MKSTFWIDIFDDNFLEVFRIFMEVNKLYNAVQKTITLADGREIMIETGKLAKQADG